MSDIPVFTVAKADPTGKEPTAGAILHITADLSRVRETLPHAIWRASNLSLHEIDARQVVAALAALPQGTIDQVLVLLLQQRASLLRVAVVPSPTLGEFVGKEAATMPQPTPENGYGYPYIEGWNAALTQLTRRLEGIEERA